MQYILLMTFQIRIDNKKQRTANRRLAEWWVKWLIEHSTSQQLLWCIDSVVLRNPPLSQAPNRWLPISPPFNKALSSAPTPYSKSLNFPFKKSSTRSIRFRKSGVDHFLSSSSLTSLLLSNISPSPVSSQLALTLG